ncbi:hypothetical protein BKA59DRAFT_558863 [Fusarium tricinctum]|uniref:Protein kinase domain-containing protein n=1 Tax=Fusarium tricinctum TaxID=61284 RepID=A0A8K0RQI8_9HYPO|nr:hypothetical protein BKA59DRAFT_558863 [Fusarium tricinctum]
MVTVGIGEGLAIASIALQLVEVAQKCAEWAERFGAFGEVSSGFQVRYNHQFRKMQALQHVLLDPEKFKLGKPLIELMEKERQHDIRHVLLCTLREVQSFEKLALKYGPQEVEDKAENNDPQGVVEVGEVALEDALPNLVESERFVQRNTTWIKKVFWASKGKKTAERTLSQIHELLQLLRDEIDQFFWTFKIPENTKGTVDKLKLLAGDVDLAALALSNPMRMRQLVIQLEMPPEEIDNSFPSNMMIEGTRVEPGLEVQPGRWFARLDGRPAITESRTYTADTFSHVLKGMQSLCALLALDKDERFRLPKAEGLYHDEDAKRFHVVILSSSVGAKNATQVSFLNKSIAEVPMAKRPLLEVRVRMALDISVATAKLHSVNWLHQGIQSRNIGLAVNSNNEPSYDHLLLLGFSKARPIGVGSFIDEDPLNNLYRHPDRWQPAPRVKTHTALHDLYSLGITLLEIGLWTSATDMLKIIRPDRKFDVRDWKTGDQVRHVLLEWMPQLGFIAGSTYQEIVTILLTAEKEESESHDWKRSSSNRRVLHIVAALTEIYTSMTVAVGEVRGVF